MKINKNFLLTITAAVLLFTGCKPESHEHTFSNEWRYDGEYHWREATCEHYSLTTDKEEHQWNEGIVTKDATEDSEGIRTYTCLVCGLEGTEEIARLKHKHSYQEGWLSDDEYHWRKIDDSKCGHKGEIDLKALHTWKSNNSSIGVNICSVCEHYNYNENTSDFVQIPGINIDGTETWTPVSEVFISGRSISIPSLLVCNHEVTSGEYKAVNGVTEINTNVTGIADNNPVIKISWYEALVYCNKLSIIRGFTPCYTIKSSTNPKDWESCTQDEMNAVQCDFSANGYRLPTEAEWEYLARGGEEYEFSGSDNADEVAWYKINENENPCTREVKTKNPNGYQLYDMTGNVWEWCWDLYSDSITAETPASGPVTPATGNTHVKRGGAMDFTSVSVSHRNAGSPQGNEVNQGFRVIRSEVK